MAMVAAGGDSRTLMGGWRRCAPLASLSSRSSRRCTRGGPTGRWRRSISGRRRAAPTTCCVRAHGDACCTSAAGGAAGGGCSLLHAQVLPCARDIYNTGTPTRDDARVRCAARGWCVSQVRVAVLQTYGLAGRMALAVRFRGWEGEALELDEGASSRPAEWASVVERRQLAQKSPFAQGVRRHPSERDGRHVTLWPRVTCALRDVRCAMWPQARAGPRVRGPACVRPRGALRGAQLLSVCHRDVVLEAQQQAIRTALTPAQCARQRLAGERGLSAADVAQLRAAHLVVLDGAMPPDVIATCRAEAEALDARGYLQPPAMHRALGDRRDRLLGVDEGSKLL
eukprot:5951173-Prymnesium_polylepis.1